MGYLYLKVANLFHLLAWERVAETWHQKLHWSNFTSKVFSSIITGKRDLEWAVILVLPSSPSSVFQVLVLCFLAGKHGCLYIHGWGILFLCLRRHLGEIETHGPVRKEGNKLLVNHLPEAMGSVSPLFPLSIWGHLCDTSMCYHVHYLLLFSEQSARHVSAAQSLCCLAEWITCHELRGDNIHFFNFQLLDLSWYT